MTELKESGCGLPRFNRRRSGSPARQSPQRPHHLPVAPGRYAHAGNAFAEKALQQKIEIMLELLGLMLKTYCEKGRMISTLELQKAVSAERVLSLAEKIRMGMNRLMMLHFRDQDRARFMRQFRSG